MRDLIDDLRVFSVPVKLTVYADIHVLATNALDARTQAIKVPDLSSLFVIDGDSISFMDEGIGELTDYDTPTIEPNEPKPIPHDEYSPEDHPSFDEDVHCVEKEPQDESDHMDDAARERGKGPFTS